MEVYVKVADYSRLILLHFLQSKLIVSVEFWHHFMNTIAVLLPQLQVEEKPFNRGSKLSGIFSVMGIKLIHWVNVF
jgi:hypothetical protein